MDNPIFLDLSEKPSFEGLYNLSRMELANVYGLLWLSVSTDNLVKVARKRLLDALSKDERKKGIEHALHSFGPVTDADMIAADIRIGIFPERSF
jgi:hypothetical protein